MKLPVLTVHDVVNQQLCTGCGACAYIDPSNLAMVDIPSLGRRPIPSNGTRPHPDSLKACPGHRLQHSFDRNNSAYDASLMQAWGPVLEVWEGYAGDESIRYAGSSGGVASALAIFCIEHESMHGVLHTKAQDKAPYLNETTLSTTREEIIQASGSRYAPASPCDGLQMIEDAPGRCVFIGKPCDVAAVQSSCQLRPGLDAKIGLTVAFFCAGTPSTNGTIELLKSAGIHDLSRITSLRYRGNGWPGQWAVTYSDTNNTLHTANMSYTESWNFLQRYRQWRCYICPDHTGEFADITVGDPWYREPTTNDSGSSIVIARTHRGRKILHSAAKSGYIVLKEKDSSLLPRSQPNILDARGNLWGRLLALRLSGAPTPAFTGFPLFYLWFRRLTLKAKAQSIVGTLRRIRTKHLKKSVTDTSAYQSAASSHIVI